MKAKNNPLPTYEDTCEYEYPDGTKCGRPYAETHEVFEGPNRQKSIQHKLQIRLCGEHHRGPLGPHMNKEYELALKKEFQRKFEMDLINYKAFSPEAARQKFYQEFGRFYD